MPSGIYVRKPSAARDAALAKGRSSEVRAKVNEKLRNETWTDEKRQAMSEQMREVMHRPEIRSRHLEALQKIPVHFKGGNGQPITEIVSITATILEPLGFIRECAIKTKGHTTLYRVPTSYKADFGNPIRKIAIELDGTKHNNMKQQQLDQKKTEVLENLGWVVLRIKHRKEVQLSHISAEIMNQLKVFL